MDLDHRMFIDRTPEAAAIQAGTVLANLIECELATYAELLTRKSASKRDRRRHREICAAYSFHAWDLRIDPDGLRGVRCPRLAIILAAAENMRGRMGEHQQKTGKSTLDVFADLVDAAVTQMEAISNA